MTNNTLSYMILIYIIAMSFLSCGNTVPAPVSTTVEKENIDPVSSPAESTKEVKDIMSDDKSETKERVNSRRNDIDDIVKSSGSESSQISSEVESKDISEDKHSSPTDKEENSKSSRKPYDKVEDSYNDDNPEIKPQPVKKEVLRNSTNPNSIVDEVSPSTTSERSKEEIKVEERVENKVEDSEDKKVNEETVQARFSHAPFDALLSTYVSPTGVVNYGGLKKDEAKLDKYIESLSGQDPQSMSSNAALAFWINAYNANTLKLILNNYPTASIMDLHGGKAWDQKWIAINGSTYTLNDIEHKVIRPTYKDARIHFAVNCAASSCPPLLNKAYTSSNVDALLDQVTMAFINNSKFNSIESDQLAISKIFEWYQEDFGDIVSYINKYAQTKVNPNAQVSFKEYDWTLNGK